MSWNRFLYEQQRATAVDNCLACFSCCSDKFFQSLREKCTDFRAFEPMRSCLYGHRRLWGGSKSIIWNKANQWISRWTHSTQKHILLTEMHGRVKFNAFKKTNDAFTASLVRWRNNDTIASCSNSHARHTFQIFLISKAATSSFYNEMAKWPEKDPRQWFARRIKPGTWGRQVVSPYNLLRKCLKSPVTCGAVRAVRNTRIQLLKGYNRPRWICTLGLFCGSQTGFSFKWPRKQFGHNVQKGRLVNIVLASYTIMGHMTEMSQRKKKLCLCVLVERAEISGLLQQKWRDALLKVFRVGFQLHQFGVVIVRVAFGLTNQKRIFRIVDDGRRQHLVCYCSMRQRFLQNAASYVATQHREASSSRTWQPTRSGQIYY